MKDFIRRGDTVKTAPKTRQCRFIFSTAAGHGMAGRIGRRLVRLSSNMQDRSIDVQLTHYQGHAAELAQDWAKRWGDQGVVYVGGGDGTLNEVANVLAGGDCAMGVLPLGTGNDFAKTVYQTRRPERLIKKYIRHAAYPCIQRIDLLKVEDRYGLNVLSIGYDTVVLEEVYRLLKKHPGLRKRAYLLAVLKKLNEKKIFPVRYELTGPEGSKSGEISAALLAIGNGQFYGSGYRPLPKADIQDGVGDIMFAETMNFREFLHLLSRYRKGEHLGHPRVQYENFTHLHLESIEGEALPANLDGIIFHQKTLDISLEPDCLPFAFVDPSVSSLL